LAVAGILIALLAADQIARANGGFSWTEWIANSDTIQFQVRTWQDDGDPGPEDDENVIVVSATRGPIVGGVCNVDVAVTSSNASLRGIRLLEADDANANGAIDADEWIEVAAAAAVPHGVGGRVATIEGATITAGRNAHRIEKTLACGVSFDEIRDFGLE